VTLTNLPMDYDIKLYNANGSEIGSSHNSGTTIESLSYNKSTAAASYYVQVFGHNNAAYSATTCYTLRVATSNVNQMVDAEGNDGWVANEGLNGGSELSVYPNPAKEHLSIRFFVDEDGTSKASITDLVGRIVWQQDVSVQEGVNTIELPLSDYQ